MAYRVFLTLVISTGVPVLVWGVLTADIELLVALALSAAIMEWFPARARPGLQVSLLNFVLLTGLLLGGTSAAVGACLGIIGPGIAREPDRRFLRTAFNVSENALAVLVAGSVFEALAQRADSVAGIVSPRSLFALAIAALGQSLITYVLVSTVISLDSGEPLRGTLRSSWATALLQVPYAALSVLAAILVLEVGPQSLLLIIVPVLVARAGLLAFQRVDEAYERLVRSFAKTIEAKDEYTKGHSERVSHLSDLVAGELRIGYQERRLVRYSAMLHDVGKIGVPLCIINKPGPLDDAEFDEMKAHPVIGENILRDIDFLLPVLDVVRHHHERLDGRGYPDGLTEVDLSQAVRIVTAVDAFDAMTSTRAYRRSMTVAEAMQELRAYSGTQFDRRVVAALETVVERTGWEPTMAWGGDISDIPDIKRVAPLSERHDFRVAGEGLSPEVSA